MMITVMGAVAIVIKYDFKSVAYMISCYLQTSVFQTELTLTDIYSV